jgi:hypothetical protein
MTGQAETAKKVKDLVQRLRQQYAGDPNIKTVGWGLAQRGGKLEDGVTIIFYVNEKLPSERSIKALGSRPIPGEIEGFRTDVQAVKLHPMQAAGDRDEIKFDPLRGGVASSNSENHIAWFNGFGTLGILARDNATGAPVALSNWHVWGDGGEEGDQIIQPGHPTTGDHVEAIGKVLACGPLVTSLIEWEAPSPLTTGLYGGAAAAAVAAAASDYRDPTRRGQDNTAINPGELTERETVDMSIEYPQLPLPGLPFKTNVKWRYQREMTDRVLTHEVGESNTNTQFLLGKLVVTDKPRYQPGETVKLTAAIWDYQPRPCDAYHVIAHLISHNRPSTALRVALHPTVCPRKFPHEPPGDDGEEAICIDFKDHPFGEYPYKGAFTWLGYLSTGQVPVRIVDWFEPAHALQIPYQGLLLTHAPASKVVAEVAQFTNTPVSMVAYNAAGQELDKAAAPQQQGVIHELVLTGEGIVRVVVQGGGGEGLLISYCVDAFHAQSFTTTVSETVAASVRVEVPQIKLRGTRLKAQRCCFTGSIALPPDENPGKWDVHLTVQNVNPVAADTPPEQAATTIGGHVLSAHTSAHVLGCTAIMLLDHVFDVI